MSPTATRHPPRRSESAPALPLATLRVIAVLTAVVAFGAALVAVVAASSHRAGASLPGEVELLVALTLLAAPLAVGGCLVVAARLSGLARPRGRRPRLVPAAVLVVALTSAALVVEGWRIGPSMALAAVGSCSLGALLALPLDRRAAGTALAALDALAGLGVAGGALASGMPWLLPVGALLELAAVLLAWPTRHVPAGS